MQNDPRPIVVIGAGAHGQVLIEAMKLSGRRIADWLVDDSPAMQGREIDGRRVCSAERVFEHKPDEILLVNAVGSVSLPVARRKVYERFAQRGYRFTSVVHPSAVIAPSAVLSAGVQVMAGAVVQTRATIGVDTIINTRAAVDHDCVIGEGCHLAPGVTLSGGVSVGDGCHLGTGATVIQGVRIGAGVMVAAGAVLTRDVPPGDTVMGVPARSCR